MRASFIVIIVITFFLSCPVEAQEKSFDKDTALRGFIWGLPKEAIIEGEKGTFINTDSSVSEDQTSETIFFLDYIKGMRSTIGYEFEDNKLWRAKVFNEKRYPNQQERINDLMAIHEDLTNRFGEPVAVDMNWLNKKEIDNPQSWGWAVALGELIMMSVWQKGNTEVTTYLGARERMKPVMSVTYVHMPTKQSRAQKQEQELMVVP